MGRTVIIDAGHGGIINGQYVTSGKRSPDFGKGVLYEGEFNRAVAENVCAQLKESQHPYAYIDSNLDVSLTRRCNFYSALSIDLPILISIHANAATAPEARGFEVFTTPGNTESDGIAELLYTNFAAEFPGYKLRPDNSDGDHDKEAKFYVLTSVPFPAILIEHAFMTNKDDYEILWSEDYRQRFANVIVKTIKSL